METALATALERQRWISSYFSEYVRASKFSPYMGKGATNIINVKYELQEESGKTINLPLITRLKGAGVTGSQVLDGAEEELGNYNMPISVDWRRHGVRVPKSTSFKTEIDLLNAAKTMLRTWESEKLRDDIIKAFLSVWPATSSTVGVNYGAITEDLTNGGYEITVAAQAAGASQANLDAWLALNSDRVLFGSLRSNITGNDHSAALSTLDTTNDILTPAVGELAKRMAKAASPHIRPYQLKDGREYFVMFCHPWAFRDLKRSSEMSQVNRDARPRDVASNPLFQDGDLIKDGIIYREIEEIPTLTDASGGSVEVGPNFLCGAQAVGIAWGQEPSPKTDYIKDYGFRPGVAIEELLGVQKLTFNGKQQGLVTVYTAVTADA